MKTKNIILFLITSGLLFSIVDKISWKIFENDIKFLRAPLRISLKMIKGIRGLLIFGIIASTIFLFAKESK
ncbi:MAG: hypothetical protein N2053_08335 [Chitinispirillaceae bacterium]|nr:hypothetical protein [Chitinispirillaceae bacterium]